MTHFRYVHDTPSHKLIARPKGAGTEIGMWFQVAIARPIKCAECGKQFVGALAYREKGSGIMLCLPCVEGLARIEVA